MFGVEIRQEGGGPVQGPGQSWSVCLSRRCVSGCLASFCVWRTEPALGFCLNKKTKPPASDPFSWSQGEPFPVPPQLGVPQQAQAGPANTCSTHPLPPGCSQLGSLLGSAPRALPSLRAPVRCSNPLRMGCKASRPLLCPLAPGPQAMWALRGSLGLLAGPCSSTPQGQVPQRPAMSTELGPTPACPCDTRLRQGPRLAGRADLQSLTAVPRLELLSSAPSSAPKDPHFA